MFSINLCVSLRINFSERKSIKHFFTIVNWSKLCKIAYAFSHNLKCHFFSYNNDYIHGSISRLYLAPCISLSIPMPASHYSLQFQFLITVLTNYHRFIYHKFMVWQVWRSEVWPGSYWDEIKVTAGLHSSLELQGTNLFFEFLAEFSSDI